MHILYLHQYFITRGGVGGTRSYEFARYMIEKGHRVTMVTAAHNGEGGRIRESEVDGIKVLEVPAGYRDYQRGTALPYAWRIISFSWFALASCAAVVKVPRPDVIFATSTPLTVGIPGMLGSLWHRVPLVFEVRDLWPAVPVAMGALKNPLVVGLARWLERTIYKRSAYVVALSPGMRRGVARCGAPLERISLIPNAADLDLFSPQVDGGEVRRRLGLEGRFVASYFGAMGEANDLSQVVEAAAILKQRGVDDVVFVLHGSGGRRAYLEEFVARRGLDNVIFSDPVPDKSAVARLAAASDVCMTIYKNLPLLATCSPNKLFDTFAAGRPALVNHDGWLRELVERHQTGVYARPGDAAHLAEQILHLRDHPQECRVLGQNGRRLAEDVFDRRKLAARLLTVLENAAARATQKAPQPVLRGNP